LAGAAFQKPQFRIAGAQFDEVIGARRLARHQHRQARRCRQNLPPCERHLVNLR